MSSIILHSKLGVNPRMIVCPKCHKDNGEGLVLMGIRNYIETCEKCGLRHVGGARDRFASLKQCKRCDHDVFTKRELEADESIEGGFCPACRQAAHCYFCNQRKDGKKTLPGDEMIVVDQEPCCECKGYMNKGIIVISIRDMEGGKYNPYRTGGFWVITESAARIVFEGCKIESILEKRSVFIEDSVCKMIGLEVPK